MALASQQVFTLLKGLVFDFQHASHRSREQGGLQESLPLGRGRKNC